MSEFEIVIIVLISIALCLAFIIFLWYFLVFILPTIFVHTNDKKARVSDLLSIERKVDRLIDALDKGYILTCEDFYLFDEFLKWRNKHGKSNAKNKVR